MADHKMDWRTFSETGVTGKDYEGTEQDLKKITRLDETWPEDSFGCKLSLGANYMDCLQDHMGVGDIKMRSNGEAVDPPRAGTAEFGQQARERRYKLQQTDWGGPGKEESHGRPIGHDKPAPNAAPSGQTGRDIDITDVVSGQKISLKGLKRTKEKALQEG